MKSLLFASVFLFAVAASFTSPADGQTGNFAAERTALRRELDAAKLELRYYVQVEYPRLRRHIDAQIQITEATVRNLQNRLREYRPFGKFTTGNPLLISIQQTEMYLLDAELRLADLQAERNNLIRFRSDQWRLLEMRAVDLRLQLAELERSEELTAQPARPTLPPPQNAAPTGG